MAKDSGFGGVSCSVRRLWPGPELVILAARRRHVAAPSEAGMTQRQWWCWLLAGVALLHGIALLLRPLLPVDETRYLGVAWEMWRDGSFWMPVSNGAPYTHKPPLLFWLIHLSWSVFGVNELTPRLWLPVFAVLSALGMQALAMRLWPSRPELGRWAALFLLGSAYLAVYQTAMMFDLLLLTTLVWAWYGLVAAVQVGRWRHWLVFGMALGLGLLSKGPIVWLYTLPLLLGVRAWAIDARPPVSPLRVTSALLVMAALPLAWLGMAWWQGASDAYFEHTLVAQALERIEGDLGHPRPWYWYLPLLPLVTLPWWLWPSTWRALRGSGSMGREPGLRFIALGTASALVLLSLMDSKQLHYLVPLVALAALALARGVDDALSGTVNEARQVRHAMAIGLVLVALGYAAAMRVYAPRFRLQDAALYVGEQQMQGRPVAVIGHYHGEFGFYGRLSQPVKSLWPLQVEDWLRANPDGLLVVKARRITVDASLPPEFDQPYRGDHLLMYRADALLRAGASFREDADD